MTYAVVPALWTGMELVRVRVFGQPWDLLGYTQYGQIGLIQLSTITGVYGISFLIVLGNTAVAEALHHIWIARRPRSLSPLLLGGIIASIASVSRLAVVTNVADTSETKARVAVVQADIAPAFRWTRGYTERQVLAHIEMTERLADQRPTLVVWPENAVPRYPETEPVLRAQLASLARRHQIDIVFGAPRYQDGRTYNSVRLVTADGTIGDHYDKQRLVLFAEAGLTEPPTEPMESPRSFSSGMQPGLLRSFVPLGVSICHEILYPDLISQSVRNGAQLLVNLSNDGWLDGGFGFASRQHFAMAVFRAVETRRYLVRATTTGVSGFVDPYGRVISSLPPNTAGALTADVAARGTLTPYVRFGDVFAGGCLLFGLFGVAAGHVAALRMRSGLAPAATVA